jgi:ATP diphosphatase
MESIEKLLEIMAALRNKESGCPWDLEQSFGTIAPYTIEEAYEVADAIDREDIDELRRELGDLLFQVVFHARMAEEQGAFDFADVVQGINEKMLRRHPHVFGSDAERAAGAQKGSWERIKAEERADKGADKGAEQSLLDGIALSLPALKRASKISERAANFGFDWDDHNGPRGKVLEELDEIEAARLAGVQSAVDEEVGDLLFSAVNLARHLKVDPEAALASANNKFIRRFQSMESELQEAGNDLAEMSMEQLEEAWKAAKTAVG